MLLILRGLPFVIRLLMTACTALLVAGAVMLYSSVKLDAMQAGQDLALDLQAELETLPPSLSELVVIGDFATLQQTLDRFVSRPRISQILYRDVGGAVLNSQDKRHDALVPGWFRAWADLPDMQGTTKVEVGGRRYGDLTVTMTANGLLHQMWQRLLNHLGILLLAVGLDFLGIWMVLRYGLRPLRHVRHGALALERGHWDTRLEEQGSPEFRQLIHAFNSMASTTERAQRDLQRSNADLIRLAEVSAHHLQEPSRRLISHAQRLKRQIGPVLQEQPDAAATLSYMVEQAYRLRDLVRDVQRYLAADQPLGALDEVNVADLWDELCQTRFSDIPRAERADPLPLVRVDRRRIKILLDCLLENAHRYAHPDRPLHVRLDGEQRNGWVTLRLSDNGIGIDPAYRDKVLEIFERLHGPDQGQGTGIGLSIVRRIVQSVGGNVWIEDGPEGGVTLAFMLPGGGKPC